MIRRYRGRLQPSVLRRSRSHRSGGCHQQPSGPAEQPPLRHSRRPAALIGDIIPFGDHPFVPAQEALTKGMNGPSRGRPTLVEFSDLQCPHCKEAQPTIEKLRCRKRKTSAWYSRTTRCPRTTGPPKLPTTATASDALRRTRSGSMWPASTAPKDITASNADEKLTALAVQVGVKGPDTTASAAKPRNRDPGASRRVRCGTRSHGHAHTFCERKEDQQRDWIALQRILKGLTEFAAREGN